MQITPLGAVVLRHGRDLLAKVREMATAIDRFQAGDGRVAAPPPRGGHRAAHPRRPGGRRA